MMWDRDLGIKVGSKIIGDLGLLDIRSRYLMSVVVQKLRQCRESDTAYTDKMNFHTHHPLSIYFFPILSTPLCLL